MAVLMRIQKRLNAERKEEKAKMRYRDATSPHGLKLIANLCKDGYTDKEIAAKLGVTDVSLSRWRRRGAKLRAVMAAARGKNENVPKIETSADKKPRTAKTSEKSFISPQFVKNNGISRR